MGLRVCSVTARFFHGSGPTEERQGMPPVARVPSFRLAVQCGGLLAVLCDGWGWDLHSSVDSRGLRDSDLVPHQHWWVVEATRLLSGTNNVGAVKVRGNLLYSAVRACQGLPSYKCPLWRLSATWITGPHPTSLPEDSWLESCQTL